MTDYVLDTMALVGHLDDSLPDRANRAFQEAEEGRGRLFLPEIALGEFVYLALKGRLKIENPRSVIEEVVDQIKAADYIELSHLGPLGWDIFVELQVPELHDRLIVADALSREAPLITRDAEIRGTPGLTTIWK